MVVVTGIGYSVMKYQTKKKSPPATATYDKNGLKMEIRYSSPFKKGRLLFGEASGKALQPYGQYWRLGANEATSFETNQDIKIEGNLLKAGKYQLYAYPGKESWDLVLGSDWDRWGYKEPDKKNEVLRLKLNPNNNASFSESLVLTFDENAHLKIKWDRVELNVRIERIDP